MTIYEMYVKDPTGGYRRWLKFGEHGEWFTTDHFHARAPFQIMER